jgi:RNA polymerase sigma-70 factor (ECF subfamily)
MNTDKSVPGWLFVVSYNKSMSYLKKKVKESIQFVENYDSYHSVAEEIFPDKALYEAQLNILEEAVNALSPQKQKVFRLCRFEGKSQEEAAQILGLSIESVKVYLKQSKFFIKEYMTSRHSMDGLIGVSILFILANL